MLLGGGTQFFGGLAPRNLIEGHHQSTKNNNIERRKNKLKVAFHPRDLFSWKMPKLLTHLRLKTPKQVLMQTEKTQMKCRISSGFTLFAKTKSIFCKRIQYF